MEEEGWEIEYEVTENVPPPRTPASVGAKKNSWPPNFADILAMLPPEPELKPDDWREPCLRIVVESVKVHIVQRVQFETDEFAVTRRRWEKSEPPS